MALPAAPIIAKFLTSQGARKAAQKYGSKAVNKAKEFIKDAKTARTNITQKPPSKGNLKSPSGAKRAFTNITQKSKGGLIKKSIDGVARKGKTKAKHR